MENEKNIELDEELSGEDVDFVSDTSSRARNRTVMLTPEITGEVRARLAKDMQSQGAPQQSGGGFVRPGSNYQPASEFSRPNSTFSAPQPPPAAPPAPPATAPRAQSFVQSPPQAPAPQYGHQQQAAEGVMWAKESPIVGFLVSYDQNPNGSVFELRTGRLIVTSEPSSGGNFLVVNDESVSPMHAIMRISEGGEIQVLDQLSEYGTRIVRYESGAEEELSGDKSFLGHGDVIVFGQRKFCVCLVLRPEIEDE